MAAIVPVSMIQLDPFTRLFIWTGFSSNSNGEAIEIWAFPYLVWQLTGHITVNTDNAEIQIMGSNDFTCWGNLHTLKQPPNDTDGPEYNPDGTVAHNYTDCIFDGSDLPRTRWLMPRRARDNGDHNDISVFLFASRPFGNRTDA